MRRLRGRSEPIPRRASAVQRIPLLIPDMPRADELIELLREIDDHRWYTNFGPLAKRFEAQLAGGFQQRGPVSVVSLVSNPGGMSALLPPGSVMVPPSAAGILCVAVSTIVGSTGDGETGLLFWQP